MKNLLNKVKANLKSGITVSLVSIPLSVSLAVASQTSPVVGIITAIWAGLIASIFGGSNYNIVGPTGALSGILATYAIIHGAGALPVLAILSGVIILVAYFLNLERFLVWIPKSAIVGFTLGVAFIIGLNQMNSAFGIKVTEVHEKFILNFFESIKNFGTASIETTMVFIVFLLGLFILAKVMPKLPGAIILTPVGILLGFLSVNSFIPLTITTLGQKYPTMSPQLFSQWSFQITPDIFVTAVTVAVIAILETMLSAKVADGMTKTKHNKRKEMLGLGLANVVTGLFGGIPATAALARTSLNIKTGATDKISATISSIAIIAISFLLLPTFKFIPMAVIAAILVFVAIRMVEIHEFKHMFKNEKTAFVLALIVAFITVYEDPIIGILFGTALSLLFFMQKLSDGQFELMVNKGKDNKSYKITREEQIKLDKEDHTLVYTIKGQLAYINSQSHISRFENRLNGSQNIIIRMRELYFIDLDGVEAIDEIIEICKKNKRNVYITGVNPYIAEMLKSSDDFVRLQEEGKIFDKTIDVLNILGFKLKER
jgi:SulP family sulfate permease